MTLDVLQSRSRIGRRLLIAMILLGIVAVGIGSFLALTGHPISAIIGTRGILMGLGGLMLGTAGVVWLLRMAEETDQDFRRSTKLYGEYDKFGSNGSNRSRW